MRGENERRRCVACVQNFFFCRPFSRQLWARIIPEARGRLMKVLLKEWIDDIFAKKERMCQKASLVSRQDVRENANKDRSQREGGTNKVVLKPSTPPRREKETRKRSRSPPQHAPKRGRAKWRINRVGVSMELGSDCTLAYSSPRCLCHRRLDAFDPILHMEMPRPLLTGEW